MAKNKVIINGIDTSKIKVLKQKEMEELFIKLKNGNKNAKNELTLGNMKLVLSILKKYQNRSDNMDDLFQIGVIGLIKAIDNFDLSFGVKFSTYAVLMIEGEIKRYIRDNIGIRISRSTKELSYKIIKYREDYLANYYKYPTNQMVCDKFNINEYELCTILNSLNEIQSIFEPIYNENGDTIYLLDELDDKNNKNLDELLALREALLKLEDRDRIVIVKRYVDGLNQSEIADFLNISQAQVSRIESNAINVIKKLIL
jgi:RNA polymerase sporulation-specific sigma factor